ncbi:MAG: ABC transporter permease subunit [Isosphaeraceae bacterium]
MSWISRLLAIARLDFAEVLRSRWLVFCSAIYGALAMLFVLVGLRESTVMGFTGMGRVLLTLCNVLVLLLPLLALAGSGQVVNRSRDDGTLEFLFSLPVTRGEYFGAVSLVRYLSTLAPLLVLLPALGLLAWLVFGEPIPWAFLGRALLISASLLWSFVGIGLIITVRVSNQAKALMYLLLVWVLGVALLDFGLIGLMLQWRLNPQTVFLLACLNPVQCARMSLLSAAEPSLGTLGPVGFYLANRLGANVVFALGFLWPSAVGCLAWTVGWRSFRRGDLV